MTKFTKKVIFEPAFDKRDPDPKKDYGIGSVRLIFILKGEKGAVQFALLTGWYLPHIQANRIAYNKPLGCIDCHSYVKRFDYQILHEDCCVLTDAKGCYCDGSSVAGFDFYAILLEDGSKGVWRELKSYYYSVFSDVNMDAVNAAKKG